MGDRPGDQQQIGETWRGGKKYPKPMKVVEGIVERAQFGFAAVARARIDMPDVQAAPEPATRPG
jgi:hypothetical protein